ncbi:MAG: Na+/H+ antiporter subunit E [Gemmatimonadales bacterium]
MFRRLLPAPLLSASLLALWLLLARSASIGQVILGLALAVAVPLVNVNLRLSNVRVRRPLVIVHFILRVGHDVLRSNLDVARGILLWRRRPPSARFVVIPLDLRDPVGLAALSMVTTVVPGTVWSELARDRSALMLHVWDVPDDAAFIARFKARYEKPLRAIFE